MSSSSTTTWMDDDKFDGMYMNVASQVRGIEPLLDTVFSFLRRKTDFFQGPSQQEQGYQFAIDTVNRVLQKHADLYVKQQQKQKGKQPQPKQPKVSQTRKTATSSARPTTTTTPTTTTDVNPTDFSSEQDVIEMTDGGCFDVSSGPSSNPTEISATPSPTTSMQAMDKTTNGNADDSNKSSNASSDTEMADNKSNDNEKKPIVTGAGPPPLGNGGSVPGKYTWTQTLSEVIVSIPVPLPTRGRDLNVKITKTHLKVQLLHTPSKDIIIDADLCKTIICDDTFWTVEDQDHIVLTMTKLNQMEWWDCVCLGDPTINVRDIQPENSSLSDLDGATRQTVEKMMYDQRQKSLGLPTSEEQSKVDLLEKFKLQHPELDFSNAKIT